MGQTFDCFFFSFFQIRRLDCYFPNVTVLPPTRTPSVQSTVSKSRNKSSRKIGVNTKTSRLARLASKTEIRRVANLPCHWWVGVSSVNQRRPSPFYVWAAENIHVSNFLTSEFQRQAHNLIIFWLPDSPFGKWKEWLDWCCCWATSGKNAFSWNLCSQSQS